MNSNPNTAKAAGSQNASKFLTIGNRIFAPSKDAMIETLFRPVNGRTADGHYRIFKGGVQLFDAQGDLFAFLVVNGHNEQFFVSAVMDNGRAHYMFALSSMDEKELGVEGMGYMEQNEAAMTAAKSLNLI